MPSFPKAERLCLRSAVDRLYADGQGFMVYPIRVVYRWLKPNEEQAVPVAVMTVAPKRKLRHAVDRNHAKRMLREAYRLHKAPLVDYTTSSGQRLAVAFILADGRQLSFDGTCKRMRTIIRRLTTDKHID